MNQVKKRAYFRAPDRCAAILRPVKTESYKIKTVYTPPLPAAG